MTPGQAPETIMTGETTDISPIRQFGWYNWVMYHDPAKFPNDKTIPGRYLGPAVDVGDDPTRIHTLRKYVGQAEDKTSVETVRAKQ